jgi:hypothetical protein
MSASSSSMVPSAAGSRRCRSAPTAARTPAPASGPWSGRPARPGRSRSRRPRGPGRPQGPEPPTKNAVAASSYRPGRRTAVTPILRRRPAGSTRKSLVAAAAVAAYGLDRGGQYPVARIAAMTNPTNRQPDGASSSSPWLLSPVTAARTKHTTATPSARLRNSRRAGGWPVGGHLDRLRHCRRPDGHCPRHRAAHSPPLRRRVKGPRPRRA